jgi:hypothetical protein
MIAECGLQISSCQSAIAIRLDGSPARRSGTGVANGPPVRRVGLSGGVGPPARPGRGRGVAYPSFSKKSFPLSSTTMKAGKSSTSIL